MQVPADAVAAVVEEPERLARELDWQPRERFDSGLRKTIEWYLDNPQWVAQVASGEYRRWVDRNYAAR